MSAQNDPGMNADSHAEVIATEHALARGDLAAAQRHLHLAVQHGAPAKQTHRLATAIQTAAQVQQRGVRGGGGRGFAVGIVAYLCLSLQQPLGWTLPVWIFLAFLLAPGLVGLTVGFKQRSAHAPMRSFWTAARSGGTAMGLYTTLHLLLIGGPHSDSANLGQELLAGLLSVFVFALIAGLAAGAVSAVVVGMRAKERHA